jgi:uncharacterized protein
MLQQSIYTYIFQRKGHFYLYNSKNALFAEITEDLYEVLYNRDYSSLPSNIVDDLINKGVICDETEQYIYYSEEHTKFSASAYNNKEIGLVIVPTTNCNFDCPYCFEGEKKAQIMSKEIEDSIIDYLQNNQEAKKIHLTWYGGEPLMAFDVIKSLYSKISKIEDKKIASHTLITNGYLITSEVIDFINYAEIKDIQITLDGTNSRHDSLRCLRKSKKPTFDKILYNLNRILEQCLYAQVNLRVNINRKNSDDFFEVYKYIQENIKSDRIYVYPGFIREDTADKCSLCYNSMPNDLTFQFYRRLHQNGANVSFIPKAVKLRGCMMHQFNSFIIGPSGELYKCWNDVNNESKIVGHINGKEIENRALFYHLLTETHPFSDAKCKNCLQFPICSGGCGWYRSRNILEKGNFNLCPIQKDLYILEESLLLSLDKNKKLYKHQISAI